MASGSNRLDWVIGWWSEGYATEVGPTLLSLIGLPELAEYEHDLVIERVIGQYYIQNLTTSDVVTVHTRLYTTEVNGAGSAPVYNLNLFDDANQQFMWHKVHVLDVAENFGARNMFSAAHPEWSHIDVKVNRKLGDLEELRFHIQPMEAAAEYAYAAWIRVLIRHS